MKFSRSFFIVFLVLIFNISVIYADEQTNIESKSQTNIESDQQDESNLAKKESLKQQCKELLDDIKLNVDKIDNRIDELRQTEEYNTYPTIRLNIDTPIFGIKSIVNQKLKITKDVTPKDAAGGYSVRSILKSKTLKMPDSVMGNLIVTTKDVNIDDDNLSITEYNAIVLKLINYVDKTKSVYDFLETQTNKFFKEYVSKDKKEKINDLISRISKLDNNLSEKNSDLLKLYFIGSDKFSELMNEYRKINEAQNSLSISSSDMLIETSQLNKLQKEAISIEAEMIDFSNNIDEQLKNNDEYDIDKAYLRGYSNLINRLDKVEKYIKNSKIEIEKSDVSISEQEVSDKENQNDENLQNDENALASDETKKVIETKEVYEVYSPKVKGELENVISKLETKMDELEIDYVKVDKNKSSKKENQSEDSNNNEESSKKSEPKYKTLSSEEKDAYLDGLLEIYNEFLKYEYNFYLDNINKLLKVTNAKITNIAKYTDAEIISDVRYIYNELPAKLEENLNNYNTNFTLELNELLDALKSELSQLNAKYIKVVELYEKMNVDEKIAKD